MEKPQIIYAFQKNQEEEVRFTLRPYKERQYVDLRIWFQPADGGDYHPTKKGITLSVEYLAELKKGLERVGRAVPEMPLQPSHNR